MKVGVIGLGNIAQKAYLPSYLALQDQADFYFATRRKEVQKELKERYQLAHMYTTLDELIEQGIEACFIHTATSSHYELIKKCLSAGIHVFVDKPVSENLAEVEELFALAKAKQKLLMVGFNRRFAPMVEQLKQIPDKRMIYLSKHRQAASHDTDYVIYDLFLHLVDTAVYLLDEPIMAHTTQIKESDEGLETATLILETAHTTAILTMDLKSGANTEDYRITAKSGTYDVRNLTALTENREGKKVEHEFGDWETTLKKRGFYPLVCAFLAELNEPETVDLRQADVITSHQLCQEMIIANRKQKEDSPQK
jgi:virulence factor